MKRTHDISDTNIDLSDANVLYSAWKSTRKSNPSKPQIQRYEYDWLSNIFRLQDEIVSGTHVKKHTPPFIVCERGKTRRIQGDVVDDKVLSHALCDFSLMPNIMGSIIYDNGASVKGRGIDFARDRFEQHLHEFYNKHHTNEGYILLGDFSKYYDNIRHDIAYRQFEDIITDQTSLWLLKQSYESGEVDVSYMSDEEYAKCMNVVYNSLEHMFDDPSLKTGEKMMKKSLIIGDQPSQVTGIFYPTRFDNYFKIVKGIRWYGRYMDDFYVISKSREFLESLMPELTKQAEELGIFINLKKTHIAKIGKTFRFLHQKYYLTDTGHLVIRIDSSTLTRMRRKLKKVAKSNYDYQYVRNMFHSWYGKYYCYMSVEQRKSIYALYCNLFNGGRKTTWQKNLKKRSKKKSQTKRLKTQQKMLQTQRKLSKNQLLKNTLQKHPNIQQ